VSADSSTESIFEPVTRPDDESAVAGDVADINVIKPAQPSVRSSRFIEILASSDHVHISARWKPIGSMCTARVD
jgi:hypothetical protein